MLLSVHMKFNHPFLVTVQCIKRVPVVPSAALIINGCVRFERGQRSDVGTDSDPDPGPVLDPNPDFGLETDRALLAVVRLACCV